MSNKVPLKELCIEDEWGKYGIPASAEEFDESKTRYLRITDISEDGELLNNDKRSVNAPDIDKYILKEGDIVFARTGNSTGKTYYHMNKNGRLAFAGFLIKYSLDSNKVNPEYLKYYTITNEYKNWVKNLSVGSTRGNINAQTFGDCPISLPDRAQQNLLVSTLSKFVNKIELNNRINSELEAMAKTFYDYWFVQFDFPDANGRPYKTSGGKMVWSEEFSREIPAGWRTGLAQDLFQFNPSLSLRKGMNSSYIDMGALPTVGYMTEDAQNKEYGGGMKFQNGDVLVARITPCLENGKTALITLLDNNEVGFGSTEFIVLRGKERALSGFIAFFSRSVEFRSFAISNMIGTSGRKRVDAKTLANFKIVIPDDGILSDFENIVTPYFQMLTKNTKENHQLAELRDWLLPMLMNGQVKVGGYVAVEEDEGYLMAAEPNGEYGMGKK